MSDVIWAAIIALGTSIVGWGLATWWQARQAARENRREHYYKTLEKTGTILDECRALGELVYQFHHDAKETINGGLGLPDDAVTDFITEYQIKLSAIYLNQRLYFPGLSFDTGPLVRKADELVEVMKKSAALMRASTSLTPIGLAHEVKALQAQAEKVMGELVNELALYQNFMVKSLDKQAAKLKIQAEPVKIDRSRMPGTSTTPKTGDG
jgi:hypothetical protein